MVILGLTMKPFSLGHLMILTRFENAFLVPELPGEPLGNPIKFQDLIFGVFTCAHTFENALASFQDETTGRKIKRWGRKVGKFDFEEKAKLFSDYLKDGMRGPEDIVLSEGEKTNLPLFGVLKYVVQSSFGLTTSEVLNMPYRQLLWEYYIAQEAKGNCKISDPDVVSNAKEMADKFDAMVRKNAG
jgi:hypothetical protein